MLYEVITNNVEFMIISKLKALYLHKFFRMVSINQLTVDFGGFSLFDNISFLISPKERIGLTGKNGAGKSTMLKIIAGKQQPTSGNVTVPKDFKIGYLPQHMNYTDTRTVLQEVELAFSEIKELEKRIEDLNLRNNFV